VFAIFILGLLFVALFVSTALRLVTIRRARITERLSAIQEYGFSAEVLAPVVLPQNSSSGMTAFVSSLGAAVSKRFGGIREDDLRAELMAAGIYTMSPWTLLGYRVLSAAIMPVAVLAILSPGVLAAAIAIASVAMGWMLPLVLVRRKARIRLTEIDRRLPDLIDVLVVTIEAGLGFTGALRVAAENVTGPLSDELRLTLQEQTMGLSVGEALANLAARAKTPGMLSFVRAMAQGERLGISIGQIMRNLSLEMRKRRRKQAEERAQKAPIKMLFPLVFLIFPAMFVVLLVPAMISLLQTLSNGTI
jgi:tight adherence protein C